MGVVVGQAVGGSKERQLEFWEAIYVPAVVPGWFEIDLPT